MPGRAWVLLPTAAAAAAVATAVIVLWVTVQRSRLQISDSSSKNFGNKREAGTEARLVKKYLTEILAPKEPTTEMFLDSGGSLFHPNLDPPDSCDPNPN